MSDEDDTIDFFGTDIFDYDELVDAAFFTKEIVKFLRLKNDDRLHYSMHTDINGHRSIKIHEPA